MDAVSVGMGECQGVISELAEEERKTQERLESFQPSTTSQLASAAATAAAMAQLGGPAETVIAGEQMNTVSLRLRALLFTRLRIHT